MGVSLDCACVHCDFVQYSIRLGSDMIMGYNYFPAYQALEKRVGSDQYLGPGDRRIPPARRIQ